MTQVSSRIFTYRIPNTVGGPDLSGGARAPDICSSFPEAETPSILHHRLTLCAPLGVQCIMKLDLDTTVRIHVQKVERHAKTEFFGNGVR